jgi:hypothetical protein
MVFTAESKRVAEDIVLKEGKKEERIYVRKNRTPVIHYKSEMTIQFFPKSNRMFQPVPSTLVRISSLPQ